MPNLKKVNGSWFMVHRSAKTTHYQLSTINWRQRRHGFTLIELLVVISIIGIMTSIGTIAYTNAQTKSRDSRRKNDLKQIQSALQLYYTDKSYYPCVPTDVWCGSLWVTHSQFADQISPTYITKVPSAPTGGNCNYLYAVFGQEISPGVARAKGYTMFTILENTQDSDAKNAKPIPVAMVKDVGNSSDGYKTFTAHTGNCPETTYNYWVNSPQ